VNRARPLRGRDLSEGAACGGPRAYAAGETREEPWYDVLVASGLHTGFELDRRWHWLRDEMDETKKPALLQLARVLDEAGVAYAIIGGIAMQVHQDEPRSTLDIDVAVCDRRAIPAVALSAAGFQRTGSFAHSENWVGAGSTPVQFTDDPHMQEAIGRAVSIVLENVVLRILSAEDMLHAKLRAAADPARRKSKRVLDLADALALVERQPALAGVLSPQERALLDRAG
jgi:hypothetical protein